MSPMAGAPLVAVGVNGTREASEAARYAAAAARERGWDLMVVHAYAAPSTNGSPSADSTPARAAAEAIVADAVSGLDVGVRTRVHLVVTPASPVTKLREVSCFASLLVLGHHHFDLADQRLTGRTASGVVADARCPVVVVPPGWDRTSGSARPVVVALDVATPAEPALRCAFEEAERRQAELVALHVVPSHGEGSVFTDAYYPDERVGLGAVLAGARQDHPDVAVRTHLLYGGDAAGRIVEESKTAALVVVGRPHPGRRVSCPSRSVARTVMSRSYCPLLIAPPELGTSRARARAGSRVPSPA